MSEAYDFSNLTIRQQELLTFQGWTYEFGRKMGISQPIKQTVRKLLARKLVVERKRQLPPTRDFPFSMTIVEYEVPLHVHIAWCQYCSDAFAKGGSNA